MCMPGTAGRFFYLRSALNGNVIDIGGGDRNPAAALISWPTNTPKSDNQQWSLVPAGNGYYYIKSKLNGYVIDIRGGDRTDGAGLINYPVNNPQSDNQLWQLVAADALRPVETLSAGLTGHPAVITTSIGTVAERRTMWVGEAARLVSPGTVEGISFALESGVRAAQFIDRHLDARLGLSPLACAGYRAHTAAKVLPRFWAGEAIAHGARSPRARELVEHLVSGKAGTWVNRTVAAVLGDMKRTG